MPKRSSKTDRPKLPADVNQRAKAIVDFLTRVDFLTDDGQGGEPKPVPVPPPEGATEITGPGQAQEATAMETPSEAIRQAAAALGRRGGLKGGKARAAKLTPEQRAEIARKAAAARWGKNDD